MKRILVLTAGYGEGHNTAAKNIVAELNAVPGVTAVLRDPFTVFGEHYERSKKRYIGTVSRAPGLWRVAYHMLDRLPVVPVVRPFLRAVERRIGELLVESDADTVVCTYPLYPAMVRRLERRIGRRIRIVTVVTDSISINRVWARTPSDAWLTADRYSARILRRLGVPADRIHATGFAVSPEFRKAVVGRVSPKGNPARVLLMAGTAARETVEIARAVAAVPGVGLTVTVGRDAALGDRVREALAADGREAAILGWCDRMPSLLREHHVVLGKAGGATTHETLAARTPFVITHVLPGQEEGNAKLIVRLGAGEVATTPSGISKAVADLFRDGAALWDARVGAIERLTRTDGAMRAAAVILKG